MTKKNTTATKKAKTAEKVEDPILAVYGSLENLYGGKPGTKGDGVRTHSAVIRMLASEGFSRAQIAKSLGKRYQHVRNVLIAPPKKG